MESLAFAPGIPFGGGLKAAREFAGLTLDDVAETTKIRKAYLAAIEAMDLSPLPSRPFAIGYVRAYAEVLGLDADRAIARFKEDSPVRDEGLRAPVGVSKEADPRVTLLLVGGALVLAAIVIWNVAQRAIRAGDNQPEAAIVQPPPGAVQPAPTGPVALGQALPPPVEATVPEPYITPGLPGTEPPKPETPTAPRVHGPPGTIYGADAASAAVTLQAVHTITLVVREGTKPVFVQVLSSGEIYRAPNTPGLTFDVSQPQSVDVFVGDQYRGALSAQITPISAILGSAAKTADAKAKADAAAKPGAAAAKPAAAKPAGPATASSAAGATKPSPPSPPKAVAKPPLSDTPRAAAPPSKALSALPSRPPPPSDQPQP